MPLIPSPSTRGQYIVRAADPARLTQFLDSLRDDPAVEVVDQIGPAGQPHTAVLTVAADRASDLEQRIRGTDQLSIEADRPLSPLSP